MKVTISTILTEMPESSYEEALSYFFKVEEILKEGEYDDLLCVNKIIIGDCYYAQSDYKNAKLWFKKGMDVKVITDLDKKNHSEAETKYKKCDSWW
jgi:tetratricopeptide (TPR) repeat protein